jgi:hypothetical protein
VKKILTIFATAIVLIVSALGQTKQDSSAKPQDTTDWLNAPTPDGSPTLRETSDWLDKTFRLYGDSQIWGGGHMTESDRVLGVHIDNDCNLHLIIDFATQDFSKRSKNPRFVQEIDDFSIPLGADLNLYDQLNSDWHRIEIQSASGMQAIRIVEDAVGPGDYVLDGNGHIQTVRSTAGTKGQVGGTTYNYDLQIDLIQGVPPAPNTPDAPVPAMGDQMGPRIISAIQHAASLCRSSYKPPVQAKEPF